MSTPASPATPEPVQPPPGPHDRRTQDIGNLVEFGHVNVRVPDQPTALQFYVTALGLTRDPYLMTGLDNAWINVGASQFHLPVGPAQVLRGRVDLVMPDLAALAARLQRVAPSLAGSRFAFEAGAADPAGSAPRHIDVRCPWGNRLRVHASDPAHFGAMALGMPCVQLDTPIGSAAGIARFYRTVFASPAHTGADGAGAYTRVPIGLGESLLFREADAPLPPYDGHHLQLTVADFSGVHARLRERGLVTEESNASQYRFERIVDPDDGRTLLTVEHEVRSMRHPMYARVLVNRDPSISARHYAAGHEAARPRLAPGATLDDPRVAP